MPAHDFLGATDQDLLKRADQCLERAGSALEPGPRGIDHFTRLHLFLEAQSCLAEILRRQAEQTAERDRKRNEEIAERDHKLEIWVIGLISAEIVLSLFFGFLGLWEGWKQGKALDRQVAVLGHMDTSTAATSDSLQKLVAAQGASLRILQQEQAEASKKPRFALYVGNIPLDKANAHLTARSGSAQDIASLELLLRNEGDAPASPSQIHVLVPEDTNFELSPIPPVPEEEESPKPATRTMSYAVPLVPVGKTLRIHANIWAPKGRASFSAAFTITTQQLQVVAPLGSLTVLPPRP